MTGQPGAGKTAVAKELSDLLWRIREPYALIDIDELGRALLPTPTSNFNHALTVANLRAVWANFYAAGLRRLILARVILSTDDIDQYAGAIPNAHITVCLLQAPAETIRERITQREPGSSRDFLLSVTTRIAEQTAHLDLPGIRIVNDQCSINEVAREILTRAEWPCPPA
ncbi:MAG: AAA family ATPase [Chloroflexota bacterium]